MYVGRHREKDGVFNGSSYNSIGWLKLSGQLQCHAVVHLKSTYGDAAQVPLPQRVIILILKVLLLFIIILFDFLLSIIRHPIILFAIRC